MQQEEWGPSDSLCMRSFCHFLKINVPSWICVCICIMPLTVQVKQLRVCVCVCSWLTCRTKYLSLLLVNMLLLNTADAAGFQISPCQGFITGVMETSWGEIWEGEKWQKEKMFITSFPVISLLPPHIASCVPKANPPKTCQANGTLSTCYIHEYIKLTFTATTVKICLHVRCFHV